MDHIAEELARDPHSKFYQDERLLVEEICASHERFAYADPDGEVHADLNLTGRALHDFLSDVGQSCSEMMLRCHFEGRDRDCGQIFDEVITDEGQCCSFNIMPEELMFRNEVVMVDRDLAAEDRWAGWDPQDGYLDTVSSSSPSSSHLGGHNASITRETERPLRAIAPGLHMGLSVIMDVKEEEYYCSGTESVGFKVLLHTPVTLPEMVEYGFAVQPGTEAFLSVTPAYIVADKSIHGMSK